MLFGCVYFKNLEQVTRPRPKLGFLESIPRDVIGQPVVMASKFYNKTQANHSDLSLASHSGGTFLVPKL